METGERRKVKRSGGEVKRSPARRDVRLRGKGRVDRVLGGKDKTLKDMI